jgi:hypothetical protein
MKREYYSIFCIEKPGMLRSAFVRSLLGYKNKIFHCPGMAISSKLNKGKFRLDFENNSTNTGR